MVEGHPMQNPYMKGKMIEPLILKGNEKVSDFVDNVYGGSGYNAKRLEEATKIFSKMIDEDATIGLTIAGAMTPIGMSGPIIDLMKAGFIDFIISTGANLYHDLHRTFNFPMRQGDFNVDDEELLKQGIARIYDVFIEDGETLMATDKAIVDTTEELDYPHPMSTADFHKLIGEKILKTAPHPEKSILAVAAKLNIPIYTSSPGDSSIGMNMVLPRLFGHRVLLDPVLDIIETTSIVRAAKKNGVIIIGGGSPKNFYLQTQPTLWQILWDDRGGHDYFIQLTTDSPHWGGLSGATPQEAKSWGKVKSGEEKNSAVVYSCCSITFPLLAQHALTKKNNRPLKEIYSKKKQMVEDLKKAVFTNKKLINHIKKESIKDNPTNVYEKIYERICGPKEQLFEDLEKYEPHRE